MEQVGHTQTFLLEDHHRFPGHFGGEPDELPHLKDGSAKPPE